MNGLFSIFVASAGVVLVSASAPAMASPAKVTVSGDGCHVSLRGEERRDHVRSRRAATAREAAARRSGSTARSSVAISSASDGRAASSVSVSSSSNGRGRSATVTQTNNGCSVVIDEELRKGAPR